ncbi:hypothetical protein AB0O76_15115 [Streptomyces sp. NPDC086554]|uniref:hypothetical protein n=1 Tax=Streptomyces sp. NPDC086554 TaxID=3154864 RepID=UPI00341EF109
MGAISGYNTTEPAPGPNNLFRAATHEAPLRRTLRTEQTVVDGIDLAPDSHGLSA